MIHLLSEYRCDAEPLLQILAHRGYRWYRVLAGANACTVYIGSHVMQQRSLHDSYTGGPLNVQRKIFPGPTRYAESPLLKEEGCKVRGPLLQHLVTALRGPALWWP